ncbi:MAG: T9SS type A sorting domain-containing protein [Bacteroidales bacterium]|nr:T9SS type A sorting domain-containing protein [Bacteroidales bacterium]
MKRTLIGLLALAALLLTGSTVMAQGTTTIPINTIGTLNEALTGTSSLFRWQDAYWSANDHGTLVFYNIDTTTAATIGTLPTSLEINDVEDIAQDETYLYLGDFGNNMGSRTDLRILRLSKSSLIDGQPVVDTIFFSFADQTNFTYENMETDYDCEAMACLGDTLYLFSKQWTTKGTTCYAVPKEPGTYVAQPRGTAMVNGYVTGACLLADKRLLLLCGYDGTLTPFIYMCYDFQGANFFGAQKRKVVVDQMGLQVEGISTANGLNVYLTNERFSYSSYITVAQKFHSVDLTDFLGDYLNPDEESIEAALAQQSTVQIYPNPTTDRVTVRNLAALQGVANGSVLQLCDASGRVISRHQLTDSTIAHGLTLSLNGQPTGAYQLSITTDQGRVWTFPFVKAQ